MLSHYGGNQTNTVIIVGNSMYVSFSFLWYIGLHLPDVVFIALQSENVLEKKGFPGHVDDVDMIKSC